MTRYELDDSRIKVDFAEKPHRGEDAMAIAVKQSSGRTVLDVAVFDGVGGHDAGALAAEEAADLFRQLTHITDLSNTNNLNRLLFAMNDIVLLTKGQTTSVTANISEQEDGAFLVTWSCIGDSRIFAITPEGEYVQISRDESDSLRPNIIYNCLGAHDMHVNQIGSFLAIPGMRIVLVSDGVTGDFEEDVLSSEELIQFSVAESPAECLVDNARKRDDRTAIVIEFGTSAVHGKKGTIKGTIEDYIVVPAAAHHAVEYLVGSFGKCRWSQGLSDFMIETIQQVAPISSLEKITGQDSYVFGQLYGGMAAPNGTLLSTDVIAKYDAEERVVTTSSGDSYALGEPHLQ